MTWSLARYIDLRQFVRPDDSPLLFRFPPEGQGMRLDAALALFLPELGLRGRRRLWNWRRITVNGRPRLPGFMVGPGDLIRVEAASAFCPDNRPDNANDAPDGAGEETRLADYRAALRLVAASDDFAALHKPAGLHSAIVAGGRAPSLEALLPEEWERLWRDYARRSGTPGNAPRPPLPLTRLDAATSGIVLAAMNFDAAERFRLAERRGLTLKTYFAVVQGCLLRPLELKNRLLTNNRKLTLVMDEDDPDKTRHTLVAPLRAVKMTPADESTGNGNARDEQEAAPRGATLVRARIQRGARHQIRAHLTAAGFPLVGEWLYPSPRTGKPGARLYLHHAKVEFPDFSALDMPGWNLGETVEDI